MAFVLLGSGVEQEWAKDPDMNLNMNVYTTEEDKNKTSGIMGNGNEQGQNMNVNGSLDNVNEIQKGTVNKAFDDHQDIIEITGHVKSSSSFRSQSRDVDAPIRDNINSGNVKNERDSPEIFEKNRDTQSSTFLEKTKLMRENLRLNFPENKDVTDDTRRTGCTNLIITRL
jgi:hypothetical protein